MRCILFAFLLFSSSLLAQEQNKARLFNSVENNGLDTNFLSNSEKLEKAYAIFSKWHTNLLEIVDTTGVNHRLDEFYSQSNILAKNIVKIQYQQSLRYLTGSFILTNVALEKIQDLENQIHQSVSEQIGYDLALRKLGISDSSSLVFAKVYTKMNQIWEEKRLATAKNLDQLAEVQNKILEVKFVLTRLHAVLDKLLKDFNHHLYKNPEPLIGSSKDAPIYMVVADEASATTSFMLTMLKVFYDDNSSVIIVVFLFSILIFFMGVANHTTITSDQANKQLTFDKAPLYATKPVATMLTVIFSILPLFFTDLPAIVLEFFILCLLTSMTFLIWNRANKMLRWRWVALLFLFVRFAIMNLIVGASLLERWGLVGLDLGAIYIIFSSYPSLKKNLKAHSAFILFLLIMAIVQLVAAVALNFLGYFNISLMLSINSVFGLTVAFAIGLAIEIIKEFLVTIDLRLLHNRAISDPSKVGRMSEKAHGSLVFVGVILWILLTLKVLNLQLIVFSEINTFLDSTRKFGSAVFTYGSVSTFGLVMLLAVWMSNLSTVLIDLYSSYRFAKSGKKHLSNAKLFFRLSVLALGLILAFMASGMPMEQLTIIIGALSVGIGFGLQNLFNNLVSGIVMAIERPVKVGDMIQIEGGITGKVKEIGLRSTTLTSVNGTNIYIPNGDLLAGKLINQMSGANFQNVTQHLLIDEKVNFEVVRQLIQQSILETAGIEKAEHSLIELAASTEKGTKIEISYLINEFATEPKIRSRFLAILFSKLNAEGIAYGSYLTEREDLE